MQSMSLLRRMMEGETAIVAGLVDDSDQYQHAVTFDHFCKEATLFDIQVAADIYWRGTKDIYQKDGLGPLRLPYESMWMEWAVPEGALVDNDEELMHDLVGMRCGAYLGTVDDGFVLVYLATNPETDEVFLWPTTLHVRTDERGTYLGGEAVPKFEGMSDLLTKQSAAMVEMFALPALMALGLINCKNVRHSPTGALRMRRSGTEKRRGVPAREFRYNTILLPGSGSTPSDKRGGSHRAAAVHKVRGHFKTFTAERPLLGRHVGTYWWGWQVRGNAEQGEVQSSYSLGVS